MEVGFRVAEEEKTEEEEEEEVICACSGNQVTWQRTRSQGIQRHACMMLLGHLCDAPSARVLKASKDTRVRAHHVLIFESGLWHTSNSHCNSYVMLLVHRCDAPSAPM